MENFNLTRLPSRIANAACVLALAGCGSSGAGGQPGSSATNGGTSAATSNGGSTNQGGTSGVSGNGKLGAAPGTGGAGNQSNTGGNGNQSSVGGSSARRSGGSGNASGVGGSSGASGNVGFSEPSSVYSAVRKLKDVLTGLAPSDADIATAATGSDGLKQLIDAWHRRRRNSKARMLGFFSDAFQQSSLSLLDFEFQLRKRPGAFDLPYDIFGDNAFPLLFQNMKESFARTALELVSEGTALHGHR